MKDIFDAKIMCEKCDRVMVNGFIEKSGFKLRVKKCSECGERIFHPIDMNELERYKDMRGKTYNVKLRIVGNSHAISIPKEVVDFMNRSRVQARKDMDDMVKLCFEDFGKLSLDFFERQEMER
jgi:hypothetical protein